MTEFEHNGHVYRIKKLNAIEQSHVQRRIAPLVPRLIPAFIRVNQVAGEKGSKKGAVMKDMDALSDLIVPFADGIASMKDDDWEYVLNTCLNALTRDVGDNKWARIWTPQAKSSIFEELNDFTALLPLVLKVIWDSLGTFINGFLTDKEPVIGEAET